MKLSEENQVHLSETVRKACVDAAQNAYEDAGFSGLCADGRWECAIEAIRHLNVSALIQQFEMSLQSESHNDA